MFSIAQYNQRAALSNIVSEHSQYTDFDVLFQTLKARSLG